MQGWLIVGVAALGALAGAAAVWFAGRRRPEDPPPSAARAALAVDEERQADVTGVAKASKETPKAASARKAPKATPKLPTFPDDAEAEDPAESVRSVSQILYADRVDSSVDRPEFAEGWALGSPLPALRLVGVGVTDRGRRKRNEDSYLISLENNEPTLFIVADGMGGSGDVASRLAIMTTVKHFREAAASPHRGERPAEGDRLVAAIQHANKIVHDEGVDRKLEGLGTTVVAAHVTASGNTCIAYVGDSRAYRMRGRKLTQLTRDHTLGERGIVGTLQNELCKGVGQEAHVAVDLVVALSKPDDVYLLCTDGLSKMVGNTRIEEILNSRGELEAVAQQLVDAANKAGGEDNITAILLRVIRPQMSSRRLPAARPVASE